MAIQNESYLQIEPSALRRIAGIIRDKQEAAFRTSLAEQQRRATDPLASLTDDAYRAGLPVRKVGRIAIISMIGVMTRRLDAFSELLGEVSTDDIRVALRAAAGDSDIGAILLVIDSPGGSVNGLSNLGDEMARAAQVKPVVAQVQGTAASAAYYAASQATQIIAERGDLIGSIGTIFALYDYHRAFEAAGVEPVPIVNESSKDFKALGMPGTEITTDQRDYLQNIVDFYFADFLATVRTGRGANKVPRLNAIADGRQFPAPEAMRLGLIDDIRSLDDTLARLSFEVDRGIKARGRMAQAKADLLKRSLLADYESDRDVLKDWLTSAKRRAAAT